MKLAIELESLTLARQWTPETTREDREDGTQFFFDLGVWLLIIVPVVVVMALAALRRKRSPELPHVNSETWKEMVEESPCPVVVHVYDSWSIGDRVIESQVALLAEATVGQMVVYWLELDKNPLLSDRYPTLESRSVALFVAGRLAWQSVGVHGHQEILSEIKVALASRPDSLEGPPHADIMVKPSEEP